MHIIKPGNLSLISISEPENDAPAWVSGTTYDIGSYVIRDHVVYVSSIDGNQGYDPAHEVQELEGARWIKVGATNTHRFFEGSLSTKTTGTSPLVIEVSVDASFNAIALFDLDCSQCIIEIITGGASKTVATINTGAEPVKNWWQWLNTVFYRNSRRFIVSGASGYATSTIRLTIIGVAPALGELIVGRRIEIGKTILKGSTSVKRRTFTTISTNDFGLTTAKKRAIARDVTYAVHAKRSGFELKERFLDDVDGIPVVTFARADAWAQFINYGFITDYEIPADLPQDFLFEITTQGVS